MKTIKIIFLYLFFGLLFCKCTYEQTLIYKKDYAVGNSKLLGLNGFYYETTEKTTDLDKTEYIYPIFFYRDGSVILMGAVKDTFQLRKLIQENPKGIWGYWGNYKITRDTVFIETIASSGGSFRHTRLIKKGLLKKDKIFFSNEVSSDGLTKSLNEQVSFTNFNIKPDSTENWIRKKKKYN